MKPSLTAASNLIPRKAWMGAGFIAASLLGSLAGQPAAAYQATFNLRTPNVSNQLTRTFIDGPPSNHTMVMTVGSKDAIAGTSVNVNTTASSGLCVINGSQCAGNETQAATFSFSKPVKLGLYNNFMVGLNQGTWSSSAPSRVFDYGLALFYNGVQQGSTISLSNLADNSSFNFGSNVLVAANTAITVGVVCSGVDCAFPVSESARFYISDVIVEVPAPLPLIGAGAAFAWTRRLRRRIKATPRPIGKA